MHPTNSQELTDYFIWGAAVSEVEIDVLTGEKNVIRSDLVEDTGASISQAVDIGQVEGSFVFGLGLWTSELIEYQSSTGKLLTDDTWVNSCLFANLHKESNS